MDVSKKTIFSVLALIAIIIIGTMSTSIFETVDSREYHIKQSFYFGALTVHSQPGTYGQLFGDIEKYPRTLTFYFSKEELDGGNSGAAAPLKSTFMGNATADVSGMIKVEFPANDSLRILLHRDYGSVEALKMELLRNTVSSALKQTGPMFRPEEAFTTRRPEFTRIMADMLNNGIPATITKTDTIKDRDSDKEIYLTKSVLKVDSLGNTIISTQSPLKRYGITITQFDIKDFAFDDKTTALIEKKKEAEQTIVAARADAERAKQSALTAEADGKARVAKAEADALVEMKTAVVNAQKEAEVARQNKIRSIEEGAGKLAIATAEASAAKLKVAAGLTPQEKAEYEMKTRIGSMKAAAEIKFPGMMIIGGGGNGSPTNPFDAVGLEAYRRLFNSAAEGK